MGPVHAFEVMHHSLSNHGPYPPQTRDEAPAAAGMITPMRESVEQCSNGWCKAVVLERWRYIGEKRWSRLYTSLGPSISSLAVKAL
ncbi:uncharacterized protein MELLADRAFT_55361 [Melampsora larici-populina 98AG31]|uniref:Uncharacterized protein n=1 Tax=Melampsora larici-populina (strain 98AG31 / pathotype 3-4-7) TaxID=747676 RepID=F4RDR0_MELLP|nr:uncharacterized protein MELLADRAFT_55361 [Melampsora larici-populina 98AG31]EGG09443.1 hypothetical protein MELLADRAFT_55361 [Melampsora larici-populina 98AG31]